MKEPIVVLAALALAAAASAATPSEQLAAYSAAAKAAADPARGQKLFTTQGAKQWSCSSCHGAAPVAVGKHASTGKPIQPLAPAANPERFTDAAKTEKWFRRNCNDVLARECTPAEKADILAWLMTLK